MYKKINIQYVVHHAVASVNMYVIYVYSNETKYAIFFNDAIYVITMALSTSLYLIIQYIFPRYTAPKITFLVTYFMYRFIITAPYHFKILKYNYGLENDVVYNSMFISYINIFSLSIFWGVKILQAAYAHK